jgi:hypothetical protein
MAKARKAVDVGVNQRSVDRQEDKAIESIAELHSSGKKETGPVEMNDVGEDVSEFDQMESKAAARAKVEKEMREAKAELDKAASKGKKAEAKEELPVSLESMRREISNVVHAGLSAAKSAQPQDPLDAEIDQITVVRQKEKTKAKVKQQLQEASMDLAEARGSDETLLLQEEESKEAAKAATPAIPAATAKAPGPPNAPIQEVKKDEKKPARIASKAPAAPKDDAGINEALKAQHKKNQLSLAAVDPLKHDPTPYSQDEFDKEVQSIQQFPLKDEDIIAQAKAARVPWSQRKDKSEKKVFEPAPPPAKTNSTIKAPLSTPAPAPSNSSMW